MMSSWISEKLCTSSMATPPGTPRSGSAQAASAPSTASVGRIPFPPGASYTNWELSADRANAARKLLIEAGLNPLQLDSVTGYAFNGASYGQGANGFLESDSGILDFAGVAVTLGGTVFGDGIL